MTTSFINGTYLFEVIGRLETMAAIELRLIEVNVGLIKDEVRIGGVRRTVKSQPGSEPQLSITRCSIEELVALAQDQDSIK